MFFFPKLKAQPIKLLILDVDGILTSGKLFYNAEGDIMVDFHVHDGLGIRQLQKYGIQVAIITSRESMAVTKRMADLDVIHVFQGQTDKLIAYDKIKNSLMLKDSEIAYMGDDLPDLPPLKKAGLAITVKNAPPIIRNQVHWITRADGGNGAVRELADHLLRAQRKI